MTTAAKLWLGFGILTLLLVLSSVVTVVRVQDIEEKTRELENARQLSAEARQLEINVLDFTLEVRAFLPAGEPQARLDAAEAADKVEWHLAQYKRMAVTERQQQMAAGFGPLWQELKLHGQTLLDAENRASEPADLKRLYDLRVAVEKFLDAEIQLDSVQAYSAYRDTVFEVVQAIVRFSFILLIAGAFIAVVTSFVVGNAVVIGERTNVESEARKTAMFDTALDCIISIDHKGTITEFNAAAEKTFGHSRSDVLGRELATVIIPPELREAHRRGLAHYLATGEGPVLDKRIEVTAIRAGGDEFPVELSITRIPIGGAPQFTAYLRDITERKNAEQALEHARDVLEQRVEERTAELGVTNRALERSNEELEQFASVASHDLQEPLRKIQAFGDRLETKFADKLGEQGRTYVERMNFSATRMRNLIDSLLTFSRVTTKAQDFVPVDLAVIAHEAVSDLEGRIHLSGGKVEVGDLPAIDADPLQVSQLLLNLIGNGLKFHKPRVPPIVVIESRISKSGMCEISVADNGIGFEEIYLDRIFEVFQRLHGRQEFEGTGMGLAICRKIAERHGGTITAKSSPGEGSTFLVTLPVRQDAEACA